MLDKQSDAVRQVYDSETLWVAVVMTLRRNGNPMRIQSVARTNNAGTTRCAEGRGVIHSPSFDFVKSNESIEPP